MTAKSTKTKVKTSTPGVYRRGGSYVYAYRVRGVQRWGSAPTLDDARRSKRQAEADADRGELRDLCRVAFGRYAREWMAGYQGRTSGGYRESTRRSYEQMLRARVIPYFDGHVRLRLAEIEPRDVKGFVRWLVEQEDPRGPGRSLSKATIRQHVAVLRALLGDATEEGVIRSNPAGGVRVSVPEGDGTGRPGTEERRALTIDELRRLIVELPEHYRLLFEFLAHTGVRMGEASVLRWGRDLVLAGRPFVKLRWPGAPPAPLPISSPVRSAAERIGRLLGPLPPSFARPSQARPPTPTVQQVELREGGWSSLIREHA